MKVNNVTTEAMQYFVSKEEVETLDREIYLMFYDERKKKKDEILKKIDNLISRNNQGLRILNNGIKDDKVELSTYEIFEEFVEEVNDLLIKIADRL